MAKKNQVARNERERKRVHQVNHGFEVLRDRVQPKNVNKKLSKADTLREAARYIKHLAYLLNSDPQQPSVSSSSTDYQMNSSGSSSSSSNFSHFPVKEEFSMYLPQNYQMPQQVPMSQSGASHHFSPSTSSPTSSVSSSSYSPTQMCYPTGATVNYSHFHH
ncbi:unnamed protein product [Caenorhabditis sp. 36 PRJEB53466]|nr:unnamed protein product [Caenorhabditis sp. 36 PRJEB53466]